MDFAALYTTTSGRINRKTWWLGSIGMMIIVFIISFVLGIIFGMGGLMTSSFGNGLMSLILIAIIFVPYRALTLKRLHDRSRPEVLFWAFIGPSILLATVTTLGLAGSMGSQEVFGQSVEVFKYNTFGNLINFVSIGVGLWALIELGFLKGDAGDNAHGADPLA